MKFALNLYLTIFALIIPLALCCQNKSIAPKYRAIHWGLDQGLVSEVVYYMKKDIHGFLWIGTQNGLCRFDGSTFKNYYNDPSKSGTFKAETADLGMVEDSMHNIWIGTYDGLFRYDILADTFSCFNNSNTFAPNGRFNIYGNYTVEIFAATSDEIFALEKAKAIVSYNVHDFSRKEHIAITPQDSIGAGTSPSYSYYDKATNTIWMIRGCCGSSGGPPGGGLLKITLNDKKKKSYGWTCFKNIPDHNHFAESMKYDKLRNCLWINSWEGLLQFTLNDEKFHYIDAMDEIFQLKDYGHASGMEIDLNNRIWFATVPKGIVIYDPSTKKWELPFPNDSILQQEISKRNVVIYCDREGMVWIGFWQRKGLYQLVTYSPVVKYYRPNYFKFKDNEEINYLCSQADKKGNVWIGTSMGITAMNPNNDSVKNYSFAHLNLSLNSDLRYGDSVFPIYSDTPNNKLWLYQRPFKIYSMDLNSRICTPLLIKDSIGNDIKFAERDIVTNFRGDLILIGSSKSDHSVYQLNLQTEKPKLIYSIPFGNIRIDQALAFNTGHLFISRTDDNSLNSNNISLKFINSKWQSFSSPLDSIRWRLIAFTRRDSGFWVIAGRQLFHYNSNLTLLKTFTPSGDGLPEITIYNLLVDLDDNLWFTTDRALYQLNSKTGVISQLSEKDGFTGFGGFGWPLQLMPNGDIYSCGIFNSGILRISPNKYINTSTSSYIQSFNVNQKPFTASIGINNITDLSLKYNHNQISIETGIIDYYSKGTSHIRYKLNDGTWQYGPARYTIRYQDLQPGKYILQMQSSNAANEFIGPIKTLNITIAPPFWRTWWAYSFYLLASIGAIRCLVQYRSKALIRRNEILEEKIEFMNLKQRASELETRALKAQMNPHFIFNCLNSINNFILKSDKSQASEYLIKFSKLIRLILENSNKALVSLDQELDALTLYVSLEKLRFDHELEFKLSHDDDVDTASIKVPPLILQPFVENALHHGLLPKQGIGILNVRIEELDQTLHIEVEDNGIGREQAHQVKKSDLQHESMGMKLTNERIALMNNDHTKSTVSVQDLHDSNGQPTGTKVIINIPKII